MKTSTKHSYDRLGFRRNVGIVLINEDGKVLIANRKGFRHRWQFPQGGVHRHERIRDSVLRELNEEVGLSREHITVLASTTRWIRYRTPVEYQVPKKIGVGQCQRWYLLRFLGRNCSINLAAEGPKSEFDRFEWVDYWEPLRRIVRFKQPVYRSILEQLYPHARAAICG